MINLKIFEMRNINSNSLLKGILFLTICFLGYYTNIVAAQTVSSTGVVIKGERPPIDISTIPDQGMEQGIIRIKFRKTLESFLDNAIITSNPDGTKRFGISGIDQLNMQFGVADIKKTFATVLQNTKYTERHRQWEFHLWYDLIVPVGTDIRSMVMAYSSDIDIQLSEPVYRKQLIGADINPFQASPSAAENTTLNFMPSDPQFNEQWHYNNTGQQSGTADADIDLPEAWDIIKGNSAVIVAVIDEGIEYTHTDLAANMWPGIGFNFVTTSSTITPGNHGTHVAGTVAANTNNATGVSGVAGGSGIGDGVRLMSCQVFTATSSGGFENAPVYAADNGAAISQNSWGYTVVNVYDQAVLDAIDYFNTYGGGTVLNGGITIFAAGNKNLPGLWYPGCYSGSFSVAATNNKDIKSYYSNFDTWVDIAAPGGETNSVLARGILSCRTGNSYGFLQGTSMACPHVSGVAGLIISLAPGILTPQDVAGILTSTSDNIDALNPTFTGKLGSGRLNAYQALLATQALLTPTANFSAVQTIICTGNQVTFNDLSLGNPTSWSWSFPGGNPSSYNGQSPPAVTYAATGIYDVSLTVSDGVITNTKTRTGYVTVKDIYSDFTASQTYILESYNVMFTDMSGCEPTSWEWSFTGGIPSSFTGQNPPPVYYHSEGTFDVSLTTSKPGATDTKTKTAYIHVAPLAFNMTNGTATACDGTFYDSGGLSGTYSNNENATFTLYPASPGAMIRLSFSSFATENSFDFLKIYNGTTVSAPLIGNYTGSSGPGTVTASNSSGALTFKFTSDGSVTNAGWVAAIICLDPPATSLWTGTINSDWFNSNNWSNGIPGPVTLVTIPGGLTNYPTLLSPTAIAEITINSGGSFIGSEFLTTGSALVKRDIVNTDYHFIASPVGNTSIGNVFPLNQLEVWAREYNETSGDWENLTSDDILVVGKGYTVQMNQPQTALFAGVINSLPVTSTLNRLNPGVDPSRVGWNLLGNPFASAIDWDMTEHSTIDGSVYIWSGTQYISWNGTSGALTNGIIPAANSFFAKTEVHGSTLTIPLTARVHSSIGFYKSTVANLLELTVEGNNSSDKTFIHFNEQATADFDNDYDAYKLFGNYDAPQLFSIIPGNILSINELPMVGNEVVNLGFKSNILAAYTLNASGIDNFPSNVSVSLQDVKLDIIQDLKVNPVYSFTYEEGDAENRFRLKFLDMTGFTESALQGIKVFSFDKTVVVENANRHQGVVRIYDITGRELSSQKLDGQPTSYFTLQVTTGTYIVKVLSTKGSVNTKIHIH